MHVSVKQQWKALSEQDCQIERISFPCGRLVGDHQRTKQWKILNQEAKSRACMMEYSDHPRSDKCMHGCYSNRKM